MSLGLEITIEKKRELDAEVEYSYCVKPGNGGVIIAHATGQHGYALLRKEDGTVMELKPCPDDIDGGLFGRVHTKLRRHWREGVFPGSTFWFA